MSLNGISKTLSGNEESDVKWRQYMAAIFAGISSSTAGLCIGWTSPTTQLMVDHHIINTSEISWVGSLLPIGGFLGAIPAGFIANNLGRKKTLIINQILMITSWVIICICVSLSTSSKWIVWSIYLARFLSGISVGVMTVTVAVYVAEVVEKSIRGTMGSSCALQVTIGLLFVNVVGLVEDVFLISILCGLISFVFLALFIWMPETPVFLLSKNKTHDARKSLQWLRGPDYQVESELNRMQNAFLILQEKQAGIADIFSDRVVLKGIIISAALMVFQQLSGANAVLFYTVTIFHSAGSFLPPLYSAIIINAVQVASSFFSSILIEKTGRRILLLISDALMAICLFLLGLYCYFQEKGYNVTSWTWVPLVSLTFYIIVYAIGFGTIPWVIMIEITPNNFKPVSCVISVCTSWLLTFIVTNNFVELLVNIGAATTFWIFCIICIIGTVFVGIFLPETKGKDIEVILEELGRKPKNISLQSQITYC